jgi:malonyl-CoA/methylmalonyl-CoA synthetase
MNFYSLIDGIVKSKPTNVAIKSSAKQVISYRELDQQVSRYALALDALGVCPGDRIIVQVDKSLPSLFLYLACLKAGYVFVPLNTAYKSTELTHFIADAEPKLFVTSSDRYDEVSVLVAATKDCSAVILVGESDLDLFGLAAGQSSSSSVRMVKPDDVAVIIYTSGTTGRSKGAMVTHHNLVSNVNVLTSLWHFSEHDTLLHALPIFHVHGLFVANHCVLSVGASMLWLTRFDVEEIIEAIPQSTVMMGVPTFYTRLLSGDKITADLCRNMRLFISGSAPMLSETHDLFEQRTGHRILERYGMSEAGMITSNSYDGVRKVGTVGLPLPGVSVRIVDDADLSVSQGTTGHIQIKGPNVFLGYRNMPEKTQEEFTDDGWFRTGDLGVLDGDNYLTIVGRSKDLIITGGYNVYPKEIELILDDEPGVFESAVFGVKHPDFGEAVTAVVVPKPNAGLDPESLIEALKIKLASYKVPKAIRVVTQLPRNAMGKVQKSLLRDAYKSD